MTKATEDDLSALHGAVARALTEVVAEGATEVLRKKGDADDEVVKVTASPAYLAAAITFLKNNNITAGKGNEDLDKLKRALENKRTSRVPLSPQALEEAAELFGRTVQ
jgi:hypothetical protein